jgi:hypothetical protein
MRNITWIRNNIYGFVFEFLNMVLYKKFEYSKSYGTEFVNILSPIELAVQLCMKQDYKPQYPCWP